MPTQFERTTISLTPKQMKGMKDLVEAGEFPDLTEAIRVSVNQFLDLRRLPMLYDWYRAHPDCCFEDDYEVYSKARFDECIAQRSLPAESDGP